MRIKTQFLISIISFGIILFIIGASVAVTQQQISGFNNKEAMAHEIQTGASDLSYISNNYFLYQLNSSISLWQTKISTLSDELSALNSSNPQQQALFQTVNGDIENVKIVFVGVTSFLSNAPRNVSIRILPSFQTQWNRMAVQIQALAFDSQQLSQVIRDQTNQAIQVNTILTFVLMAIFGAFFITIYLINYRGTLRSISKLKNGIEVLGSGNLDYTVEAGRNDEIEDISKSVNQMATNLKTVTASKTDLERAQTALRESEQRWATTLASIGDAVIATDPMGKITFMNGEAESLTGWILSEASQKSVEAVFNIVNEQTRLGVESPIARVLREGMVVGLANHTVLIRKDLSELPIDDSGAPIKDKDDKTTGVVLIFRDITERKKAEETLRSSEQKAIDLIKYAPSGIYELDYRIPPKFRSVNDAMCQILGYTREELLATSPFTLLDDEGKTRFRERIVKMLAGEKVDETVEFKVKAKGGRDIYAVLNVTFTYKDGKPDGALVVAHDVTERRKAERALEERAKNLEILVEEKAKALRDAERLAAIGATAGMVGHDIRNPLQAITSDVYLAKSDLTAMPEGEEKQDLQESLVGIEKNVEYINKIVQDLQDYARPLSPGAKETDIEALFDDVLVKKAIPEGIKVSREVEAGAEELIADPDLLKRVMVNLVNNAVQAMPEGGKLSVHAFPEGKDIVLSVEDTGVGIPENAKPRLFTPLFTTKSKGQGFGLVVVKRMTEAMGGTITFESEVGKGTKFIVRLPQKK